MSSIVPPHGGELVPLLVPASEKAEALRRAESLRRVRLTSKEVSDLMMLAMGAYSPLRGFMREADYRLAVSEMRLSNGLLWPIPITLSISAEEAREIPEGETVALVGSEDGEILAGMVVEDKYAYDKRLEVVSVFGTEARDHPGVQKTYQQGEVYLGGPVTVFNEGGYPERFPEYARPAETRAVFESRGWSTVAAFQTRNPLHRSHEYLTKVALEICDGLLIHPVVGDLKAGDIPAEVRMECYKALLENYYPQERVVLKVYPMEMRYAGPREAVLHAIIRQNFGCSHLIVGRDHAGVGSYYGPFDAQDIFDKLSPGDLHIQPLKLDVTYWCNKCDAIASSKTCPHPEQDHLSISGTKLRAMLENGERPPEQYSRREVVDILIRFYKGEEDRV